jgi:hypothetical protein
MLLFTFFDETGCNISVMHCRPCLSVSSVLSMFTMLLTQGWGGKGERGFGRPQPVCVGGEGRGGRLLVYNLPHNIGILSKISQKIQSCLRQHTGVLSIVVVLDHLRVYVYCC